jgi:autotransporter-associated beta strand protein
MRSGKNPNRFGIRWLIAFYALTPAVTMAQSWISPVSVDWHTPGNWSGGNVPNTNGAIASFNTPGLANPQITADTTVNGVSASQSYTIGGDSGVWTLDGNLSDMAFNVTNNATLVIDRDLTTINSGGDITARIMATPGSTVTFAAGNTWTSNHGIAFQDVSTDAGGTFNFNGALALGINYFQVFNGFSAAHGGVVNFNPTSVTGTVDSQIQNTGGKGRLNFLVDFTASKIVLGNPAYTPSGPTETYLVTNGMSMSRNVEVELANSFLPGSVVHQYGVDIPGAGTATQAGSFRMGSGGFGGDTYKIALDVKTDDTMIMTGAVIGGTGLRANVTQFLAKTGPGLLRLEGATANTWTGDFRIEEGTVLLNKSAAGTNAISGVLTTVSLGAELQLGKANQIANTGDLTLSGGVFDTGGFSETLDVLSLTQSSTIDFGAGASTLLFSQFASGSGTLTIDGWSGDLAGNGADQFEFTNTAGISGYLSNIHFTGYAPGAQLIGNEVVPIPEPSTGVLLLMAGGLALARRGRRAS